MLKSVIICTGRRIDKENRVGAWSSRLIYGNSTRDIQGYDSNTTIYKIELECIIKSLEELTEKCKVDIYIHNKYVSTVINQYWANGIDPESKYLSLWSRIGELLELHMVYSYVTGTDHINHVQNELSNRANLILKELNQAVNEYTEIQEMQCETYEAAWELARENNWDDVSITGSADGSGVTLTFRGTDHIKRDIEKKVGANNYVVCTSTGTNSKVYVGNNSTYVYNIKEAARFKGKNAMAKAKAMTQKTTTGRRWIAFECREG